MPIMKGGIFPFSSQIHNKPAFWLWFLVAVTRLISTQHILRGWCPDGMGMIGDHSQVSWGSSPTIWGSPSIWKQAPNHPKQSPNTGCDAWHHEEGWRHVWSWLPKLRPPPCVLTKSSASRHPQTIPCSTWGWSPDGWGWSPRYLGMIPNHPQIIWGPSPWDMFRWDQSCNDNNNRSKKDVKCS